MSGREARGERWQFAWLAHELQIVRGGRLDYLERYRVEPRVSSPAQRWSADDCCYMGTVIASHAGVTNGQAEQLHQELQQMEELRSAVDLVEEHLLLVRLLSPSGPIFHDARHQCRRMSAPARVVGDVPAR